MTNLVRAELLAARGTRSVWLLGAVTALFCVGWAVLEVLVFLRQDGDTPDSVYSMAGQGYLLAMVLGMTLAAGDYRHRTITWALLVTPRRSGVVLAKLVAWSVLGLVVGLVAVVVTAPVTAVLLAATGHRVFDPGVVGSLAGSALGTMLWTTLGAACGMLIRNQAVAVTVALVWFYYAEWALVAVVPVVGRWTPTGAAKALSGWVRSGLPGPGSLLPVWAGGLLLLGYAVAAAFAARVTSVRRDVT